jgi:hypothetical protein
MPSIQGTNDQGGDNYSFEKGAHWDPENVKTILQWIHIAAINLDVMSEATMHYKRYIRRNTIISLILSTLASTASLSQFNVSESTTLALALKIAFTAMTALITVSTGYIKVYQIQEKLEKAIKLQQEWTSFGSLLSGELQLPVHLRKDALYLIIKFKDTYNELFKQQIDISQKIIRRVAVRNGLEPYSLSLSELFERVLEGEAERMKIANQVDEDESGTNSIQEFESKGKNELNKVAKLLKGIIINSDKAKPVIMHQRQKVTNYIMKPTKTTQDEVIDIDDIAGLTALSQEAKDILQRKRSQPTISNLKKTARPSIIATANIAVEQLNEDSAEKNIVIVDKE